ncbi:MAG: hypothetical protein E6K56_00090, partial [Ignavibacteria bacterium]
MKRIVPVLAALMVMSHPAPAQVTPWQWVNPLPQGNLLNSIWASSTDTAVSVGDLGTILKTTNGGLTWNVQFNAAGITDQLFAVQFATSSVGWAAGGSGRILKTTDGGITWDIQNPLVPNDLYAIDFVSPTTGWTCGFQGAILKTTNGGLNWTQQNSSSTSTLYSLYFLTPATGWAVGVGGTILKTTDAGTTWVAQTSGTTQPLFSVYFTSPSVGFTVGAFGLMFKTNNGGATWIPLTSGTNLSLFGLQFASSLNGWVIGEYGTIIKTTNGGISWFAQTSQTFNDLFGVRFVSTTTGWTIGDFGTMIKTTDGGTTWTPQSNGIKNSLAAISFPSVSYGYTAGDIGTIASTTDGGRTWTQLNSGSFQPLWGIDFISNTTGWVVGDSATILRTTNSGFSWSVQHSHTDPSLYSVHMITSTTGWTVGDFGTILATSNAGITWTPQVANTTQSLLRVKFANATTGWAVGYGGTIIKTTNGGSSWAPQTSGTTQALYSLEVISPSSAYAGGDFGVMVHTTNGGTTWTSQTTNTDATIYGLSFYSPSVGFAAGDVGTILYTNDGGATWTLPYSPTVNTLFEAQVVKTGTGAVVFATGTGGTIICSAISPLPIRSWTGAFDSLWTSPGNWSPAGTPIKGDSVVIPLTANKPVLRAVVQEINLGGLSIAADAKLTIGAGLSQLIVKGSINIFGTLNIEANASPKITVGGNFSTILSGAFNPGNSTIVFTGPGQIKGSFNDIILKENAVVQTGGNVTVRDNITLLSNLFQRQVDTLTILNPSPGSFQGPAFVTGGTVKRALQAASIDEYRFESPGTFLRFYGLGTLPDTVLMTAFPNTFPPGLPDSLFVKRYYTITALGGSNYQATLSLRYDSIESAIPINELSLFRDSSGVIFNMGSSDYLDSDIVAVSLDSVRSFSKWYLGRSDYLPVHPFAFLDTLVLTDHGGLTGKLVLGAQAGASDGIDAAFGETELAARPPAGTLDVRWVIPPTRGTSIDIRNLLAPPQQRIYTFTIQPGAGGYPFTLNWNKAEFATGTFLLQDQGSQGGLFSVSMKAQNSFVVTNSSVGTLQIVHLPPVYYSFNQSWNMVSLPLTATNGSKRIQFFPTAVSPLFGYNGGYYISDSMHNGVGYWLRLSTAQILGFDGLPRPRDTINVADGWITNSYIVADSIRPSKAYWVKVRGAGKLVLSATGAANKQIVENPTMDGLSRLNLIGVEDQRGDHQALYFGAEGLSPEIASWYELPPTPPGGLFDARFQSGSMVQSIAATGGEFAVRVQSDAFPIRLSWNLRQGTVRSIAFFDARSGAPLSQARTDREGGIQINAPFAGLIGARVEMSGALPRQFALRQN